MKKFCSEILLACVLLVAFRIGAANVYVSPAGNDGNDGKSPERALRTPQRAADISEPGDVVLFAGGEYAVTEGQGLMVIRRSGLPDKPITYAPMPGEKVTFRNRGAWQAIKIEGASRIHVRGFHLRGMTDEITLEEAQREMNNLNNPRTCGNGLLMTSAADKSFPTHITVSDCDIRDFPGGGIAAMHADYLTFENNVVARCGFWAPYANSGISIYQPQDSDDNEGYKLIIRGNVSFENYNNIPFYYSNTDPAKRKVTDGNGIILDDYRNTQAFGKGTGKPYMGKTLVTNNVVFDNGGSGIHVFLSSRVDIVHNYAANNNRHPDQKDGQIFSNSTDHVRILNNVLVAHLGKPVNSNHNNKDGVIYDYNLYAAADGSTPKFTRSLAHNILAQPGLTLTGWSEGKREIKSTADSALRNSGTPFPDAGLDFFGKQRSAEKPAIGPFEIGL